MKSAIPAYLDAYTKEKALEVELAEAKKRRIALAATVKQEMVDTQTKRTTITLGERNYTIYLRSQTFVKPIQGMNAEGITEIVRRSGSPELRALLRERLDQRALGRFVKEAIEEGKAGEFPDLVAALDVNETTDVSVRTSDS